MREAEIRDYLAEHLDLIEPGLKLVDAEFPLPNKLGASGRIDLLAKDPLGTLVVVELKKSDSAARTALHELLKYIALLQSQKGIPTSRLRCILVSTTWRELLVPFSELVHSSPFSLQGRRLLLDSEGQPVRSEPVVPLPPKDEFAFPTEFGWMVFGTSHERDAVAGELRTKLPRAGLRNFVLISLTSLEPEELMFPFSLIVCLFEFTRDEAAGLLEQKAFPVELLADYRADETLSSDPKAFCRAVRSSLESKIFCMPGVNDVHYSRGENLAAERAIWHLDEVYRFGPQVSDQLVLTNEELLEALTGSDGSGDVAFTMAADPGHKAQFAKFSGTLEKFLTRYGWWSAVEDRLQTFSKQSGRVAVARAFCPPDFLARFAFFLHAGDAGYLPGFDLVLAERTPVRVFGFVAWDGLTTPPEIDEVFQDKGGGNVLRVLMSEQDDVDRLVSAYGLVFPVVVLVGDDAPTSSLEFLPLETWAKHHPRSVSQLTSRLGRVMMPN